MNLNELIGSFKSKSICWYPSAGYDLKAINHWNIGLGNQMNPTVFIFTDIAYDFNNNELSYEYENYNILLKEVGEITIDIDIETYFRIYGNDQDEVELKNKFEEIVGRSFGNFDTKEDLKSDDDFLESIGFCDIESSLKEKFKTKNIISVSKSFKYGIQLIEGKEILFINMPNKLLVYSLHDNTKIQCLMVRRHCDDDCFINNLLSHFNIQECILAYTAYNSLQGWEGSYIQSVNSFIWDGRYGLDHAGLISKVK